MPQLFLGCDGVLADFDGYATELLGVPPRQYEARHGPKRFWSGSQPARASSSSCR